MNIFSIVRDRLTGILKNDLDSILGSFSKLQDKLQTYVDREMEALRRDTETVAAMQAKARTRNATIDRAYRTIHKLDQLTA